MKKWISMLTILLMVCSLSLGCKPADESTTETEEPTNGAPENGDADHPDHEDGDADHPDHEDGDAETAEPETTEG